MQTTTPVCDTSACWNQKSIWTVSPECEQCVNRFSHHTMYKHILFQISAGWLNDLNLLSLKKPLCKSNQQTSKQTVF